MVHLQDSVEKLTLVFPTQKDREKRHRAEEKEDAEAVHGLCTPNRGKREQLWEEVLRQLQGDGPMERLYSALQKLDAG